MTAARVRAAAGHVEDRDTATNRLRQVLSDATRTGFVNYALEARLALGELEVTSGNRTDGRGHLESLLKDASEKGFRLVAQQAAVALTQSGSQSR